MCAMFLCVNIHIERVTESIQSLENSITIVILEILFFQKKGLGSKLEFPLNRNALLIPPE